MRFASSSPASHYLSVVLSATPAQVGQVQPSWGAHPCWPVSTHRLLSASVSEWPSRCGYLHASLHRCARIALAGDRKTEALIQTSALRSLMSLNRESTIGARSPLALATMTQSRKQVAAAFNPHPRRSLPSAIKATTSPNEITPNTAT